MPRLRTKRYAIQCQVCEAEFYSARPDTKTCSVACRKRLQRDNHYVPVLARRIYKDLRHLAELVADDQLPIYRGPAWLALVGLSSYLAKVVSDKSLRELEAYTASGHTRGDES